jgi:hypothetical protein
LDISGLGEQLASEFQESLGAGLASLSLHGMDTPLFWPAYCLVVLSPGADLQRLPGLLAKWRRRGLAAPLFLAQPELAGLRRYFPLELLNLRLERRQLVGEDLLAALELEPEHLRHQCGRELKGKAVVLRRSYCLSTLPEELVALISASLPLFLAVFRGLLKLEGQEPPLEPRALIAKVSGRISLNGALFGTLLEAATGQLKPTQDEIQRLLTDYMAEAERLARVADF